MNNLIKKGVYLPLICVIFASRSFAAGISDRQDLGTISFTYNGNKDNNIFKYFGETLASVGPAYIDFGNALNGADVSPSEFTIKTNLIDNYIFDNNVASMKGAFVGYLGGIIYADFDVGSDVTISNSYFRGNKIDIKASFAFGGVIASTLMGNYLAVENTIFSGNEIINDNDLPRDMDNESAGGAIFTISDVRISGSTFENNRVISNTYSTTYGGAIANFGGNVAITDSSFFGNSVMSSDERACGGAIYNGKYRKDKNNVYEPATLTIIAENKDVVFSNNTAQGTNTQGSVKGNDIHNQDDSVVNLFANEGRSIMFDGGITGDGSGTVNINGGDDANGEAYNGTIELNSVIEDNTVNMYGGTLKFGKLSDDVYGGKYIDGKDKSNADVALNIFGDSTFSLENGGIGSVDLTNLKFLNSNALISLALEVDYSAKTVDSILLDPSIDSNRFKIENFYILNDNDGLEDGSVAILLSDIFNGVDYKDALVADYKSYFPTQITSEYFNYDVVLGDDDNTVEFVRRSEREPDTYSSYLYNQTVSTRQLAGIQHHLAQNLLNKDNFMFDVATKKLILSDRIKYRSKIIETTTGSGSNKVVTRKIYSLVRVDSESDSVRMASGEDVYGALAMLQDVKTSAKNQQKPHVWFNIMGLKDTVKYDDFHSVKDDYFTALLGITSKTKTVGKGYKVYGNVYFGYLKGTQKYDGNKIENDGGYLGASGFIEKGNAFAGLTINGGISSNDAKNDIFGKDSYDNSWFTIGTKFGYNYNIGNSGYSIEPSLYLTYVFVGADSYTSRTGVRINQENLNSFQIAPSLKLSKVFKNDLNLSIKAKYVYEVINDLDVEADNLMLPDLTNDPFIEYGISIDKKVKDVFSVNAELNRRDGGKRGWNGTIGAKFYF